MCLMLLTASQRFTAMGFDKLPICMAKTQYSFSHDATLKGKADVMAWHGGAWHGAASVPARDSVLHQGIPGQVCRTSKALKCTTSRAAAGCPPRLILQSQQMGCRQPCRKVCCQYTRSCCTNSLLLLGPAALQAPPAASHCPSGISGPLWVLASCTPWWAT